MQLRQTVFFIADDWRTNQLLTNYQQLKMKATDSAPQNPPLPEKMLRKCCEIRKKVLHFDAEGSIIGIILFSLRRKNT